MFLLDLDEFKNLPKHVKAIDVLAEKKNGTIQSIGGGKGQRVSTILMI